MLPIFRGVNNSVYVLSFCFKQSAVHVLLPKWVNVTEQIGGWILLLKLGSKWRYLSCLEESKLILFYFF